MPTPKEKTYSQIITNEDIRNAMKAARRDIREIIIDGFNGYKDFPSNQLKKIRVLMNDFTFAMLIIANIQYALKKDPVFAKSCIRRMLRSDGTLTCLIRSKKKSGGAWYRRKYMVDSVKLKNSLNKEDGFKGILMIVYDNDTEKVEELLKKLKTKAGRVTDWFTNGPDVLRAILGVLDQIGILTDELQKSVKEAVSEYTSDEEEDEGKTADEILNKMEKSASKEGRAKWIFCPKSIRNNPAYFDFYIKLFSSKDGKYIGKEMKSGERTMGFVPILKSGDIILPKYSDDMKDAFTTQELQILYTLAQELKTDKITINLQNSEYLVPFDFPGKFSHSKKIIEFGKEWDEQLDSFVGYLKSPQSDSSSTVLEAEDKGSSTAVPEEKDEGSSTATPKVKHEGSSTAVPEEKDEGSSTAMPEVLEYEGSPTAVPEMSEHEVSSTAMPEEPEEESGEEGPVKIWWPKALPCKKANITHYIINFLRGDKLKQLVCAPITINGITAYMPSINYLSENLVSELNAISPNVGSDTEVYDGVVNMLSIISEQPVSEWRCIELQKRYTIETKKDDPKAYSEWINGVKKILKELKYSPPQEQEVAVWLPKNFIRSDWGVYWNTFLTGEKSTDGSKEEFTGIPFMINGQLAYVPSPNNLFSKLNPGVNEKYVKDIIRLLNGLLEYTDNWKYCKINKPYSDRFEIIKGEDLNFAKWTNTMAARIADFCKPPTPAETEERRTINVYWPPSMMPASQDYLDAYKTVFETIIMGKKQITGLYLVKSHHGNPKGSPVVPFIANGVMEGKPSRFNFNDLIIRNFLPDVLSKLREIFVAMKEDKEKTNTTSLTLDGSYIQSMASKTRYSVVEKKVFQGFLESAITGIDKLLNTPADAVPEVSKAPSAERKLKNLKKKKPEAKNFDTVAMPRALSDESTHSLGNLAQKRLKTGEAYDKEHYPKSELKGKPKLIFSRKDMEDMEDTRKFDYNRRFYMVAKDGLLYRGTGAKRTPDPSAVATDYNNELVRRYFAEHPEEYGANLDCDVVFDEIKLTDEEKGDYKREKHYPSGSKDNGVYLFGGKGGVNCDLISVARKYLAEGKTVLAMNAANEFTAGGAAGRAPNAVEEDWMLHSSAYQNQTGGGMDEYYIVDDGKLPPFAYNPLKFAIVKRAILYNTDEYGQVKYLNSEEEAATLPYVDLMVHSSPNFNPTCTERRPCKALNYNDDQAKRAIQESANQMMKAAVQGGYDVFVINNLGGGVFLNSISAWAEAWRNAINSYGRNIIVAFALFDGIVQLQGNARGLGTIDYLPDQALWPNDVGKSVAEVYHTHTGGQYARL